MIKIVLLLLFSAISCFGQEVDEIIIENQMGDEPPVKKPYPVYQIIFRKIENGQYQISQIKENSKKLSLKKYNSKITLEKNKVDQTLAWIAEKKNTFSLRELNVDYQKINEVLKNTHPLFFTKEVDQNLLIRIDSFDFCNAYEKLKTIIIGGDNLKIIFKWNHEAVAKFTFDTREFDTNDFNWRDYYTLCGLLKNKLDFPHFRDNIFDQSHLNSALIRYLRMAECEGYYFEEFAKSHPERTKQENRMRTDWNFVEYMKTRKTNAKQ